MIATLPMLAPDLGIDGVQIRVTTRHGGVSSRPYDSLNLGDHVGDVAAHVEENQQRLKQALPVTRLQWLKQVHCTRVVQATHATAVEADAQWTCEARVALGILTADCLPVALATLDGTCVGVAHAGWRGLAAGVLESLVAAMPTESGRIIAWLGPAIGAAAYEVGPEVKDALMAASGADSQECFEPSCERDGHWMADLAGLARRRLEAMGIARVLGGDRCTYSEPEQFFSHRRDGPATGRMATIIWRES